MGAFASYLDVPETHVQGHRASPSIVPPAGTTAQMGVRIHSGKDRPAHTFSAIYYRDY